MKYRLPLPSPSFIAGGDMNRSRAARRTGDKVVPISSHPDWRSAYEQTGVTDLTRALRDALVQIQSNPVLNMSDDHVTVARMMEFLHRRLEETDAPLRLSNLMLQARSERALICLHLALLELVRLRILLPQSERYCAEILLTRNPAAI